MFNQRVIISNVNATLMSISQLRSLILSPSLFLAICVLWLQNAKIYPKIQSSVTYFHRIKNDFGKNCSFAVKNSLYNYRCPFLIDMVRIHAQMLRERFRQELLLQLVTVDVLLIKKNFFHHF